MPGPNQHVHFESSLMEQGTDALFADHGERVANSISRSLPATQALNKATWLPPVFADDAQGGSILQVHVAVAND